MFRLGSADVPLARRTVRAFTAEPVDAGGRPPGGRHRADRARAAPQRALAVRDRVLGRGRTALLDAMREAWIADLRRDGFTRSRSPAGSGAASRCGALR
jgi:coenzyme F420-0:L-glutamate ligase/coenzyme F420-1:gamma-L-glutamate ligase